MYFLLGKHNSVVIDIINTDNDMQYKKGFVNIKGLSSSLNNGLLIKTRMIAVPNLCNENIQITDNIDQEDVSQYSA